MSLSRESHERGVVLVITIICIMGLLALVGLVIDSGTLEYRKLTLRKAASAATLRASQLYFDSTKDNAALTARVRNAAKESARLNLLYSGMGEKDASRSAGQMNLQPSTSAGVVKADIASDESLAFAKVIPDVGSWRGVRAAAAASYKRKESGKQHYSRIYIIMSIFSSMGSPLQGSGVTAPPSQAEVAQPGSKSSVGVEGLQALFDALDGQKVTIYGYGSGGKVLTDALPVNDSRPSPNPLLSNRDYAKTQAEKLRKLDPGAALSDAFDFVLYDLSRQKLSSDELKEVLVLVLSDSIGFDVFKASFGGSCSLDIGRALQGANAVRALGAKVDTIALFTDSEHLALKNETLLNVPNLDTLIDEALLFGRDFLKSLANAHDKPVLCDLESGSKVYPNNLNVGRYLEPRSPREVAVYIDELTSKPKYVSKLPRRIEAE